MAVINRKNIGLLTDEITLELNKEDYYPSFEKALKTYSKQVKMQGFRPGQVPINLIKKMHGPGIFADEVIKTIEKEINQYLTTEKPEIFARPLPSADNSASLRNLDMNVTSNLKVSFEIGLKPEIKIAPLKKAIITRHKVTVTDDMINDEVGRLQTRYGKMTEPEAVNQDDNVLNVHFSETDAEGNELPNGVKKDNSLLVKYFGENVRPSLIGLKQNDFIQIKLKDAFEEKELEWIISDLAITSNDADKHFKITITKIGLVEKRELNKEFFDQVYTDKAIETENAFKEAVAEDIQNYWNQQGRGQVDDEIYHYLLDNTEIELPEGFLKRWLQEDSDKPKTNEEVEAQWPSFKNSLKWTLISDTLIKDNNIEVNAEELRAFAKQQILGYMGGQGRPEDMPWLDAYVDRMIKDQKYIENTYNQLATDKLFLWAETQVKYKEVNITAEDFLKQLEHHRTHHHH